ncbi:MAG: MFS transporter, partial [Pseudomonadota bacterium]
MSNKEHVLPARLKLFWGSGAMGVAMLMNGVSFLILIYLVSVLKLDPALAGTLVFLSKIIDAISDPIVGMLSDRSTFKSGRRRPFMFVGAFLAASSFGFLFAIPEFESQTMTAAYAFGCLVFYTIGYTVFN